MRYTWNMDQQTIDVYNKMALEYDQETTDFWVRFPVTFIDSFASKAKGKVLDVGSGPGRDALILREKGLDITCLDASEEMVKLCLDKGLKAVVGDFNDLKFYDKSFGGVWAYTSLLHDKKADVLKSLKEVHRVLSDDGILGLGLIEGEFDGYRESSGMNMPRWFAFYKREEIEAILKDCGFEIIHFEQFKPGSKNYLNYICKKV